MPIAIVNVVQKCAATPPNPLWALGCYAISYFRMQGYKARISRNRPILATVFKRPGQMKDSQKHFFMSPWNNFLNNHFILKNRSRGGFFHSHFYYYYYYILLTTIIYRVITVSEFKTFMLFFRVNSSCACCHQMLIMISLDWDKKT